jgi:hypothetical protein
LVSAVASGGIHRSGGAISRPFFPWFPDGPPDAGSIRAVSIIARATAAGAMAFAAASSAACGVIVSAGSP